jgi:hypothetical protein
LTLGFECTLRAVANQAQKPPADNSNVGRDMAVSFAYAGSPPT